MIYLENEAINQGKIMVFLEIILFSVLILLCFAPASDFLYSQEHREVKDIEELSLESLLNVEVSSVSKKEEKIMDVASSIYVIAKEDIRRSGATRIIDLLQLVPGFWLTEITYSLSFNGIRNNAAFSAQTVLVLVDGVPIASTGISYENFDIPLQQIERIEVIKGPGGTIYGANANTGIVNIFTKASSRKEGLTLSLEGGTLGYLAPFIKYTVNISEKASFSAYAQYRKLRGYDKNEHFEGETLTLDESLTGGVPGITINNRYPSDETDGRKALNWGLDLQYNISSRLRSSTKFYFNQINTKLYTSSLANPTPSVTDYNSYDILAAERLDFNFNDRHHLFLGAKYFFLKTKEDYEGGNENKISFIDLEVQDNLRLGIHNLSFGANFRAVWFGLSTSPLQDANYQDPNSTKTLFSGFFQDKIDVSKKFNLTFGLKAERWTLVSDKIELLPSVRVLYKAGKNFMIWGAFSRSFTTPGYNQTNLEFRRAPIPNPLLFLPGTDMLYIALVPGEQIKSTEFLTYEFGLRSSISPKTYIDISAFYNTFNNGIGVDTDFQTKEIIKSKIFDNFSIWPVYYTNTYKGSSYGGEIVVKVKPLKTLKMEFSYSLYKQEGEGLPIPGDSTGAKYSSLEVEETRTPAHVVRFRPYLDFPKSGLYLTLHAIWSAEYHRGSRFNYVSQLADPVNGIYIDPPNDFLHLDFSIEKRLFKDKFSIIFWGRNVLCDSRVQYFSEYLSIGYPHPVHRSFGIGINYNFDIK